MNSNPAHLGAGFVSKARFFVLFLLVAATAFAEPVKFDIPQQPVSSALLAFSKQSGVDVLYTAKELRTLQSLGVTGELDPVAALTQLLAGTGYSATEQSPKKYLVQKIMPGSLEGSVLSDKSRPVAGAKIALSGTDQSVVTDRRGRFAFPEVPAGAYTLLITADGVQNTKVTDVAIVDGHRLSLSPIEVPTKAEGTLALDTYTVSAKKNDGAIELDPYAVTGTKAQPFSDRNVDLPRTINDVQPYYIFDSRVIEESGTSDVESFLRQRLTMDTTVQTNRQITLYQVNAKTGINSGNVASTASSIDLQGLGADHTLILVNGLPMAGVSVFNGSVAAPGQPDVNGIPLAAIERIEVLPSSAGAIYGAGAEGGVINIILKKAYNGGDITATYGATWDGHGPSRTIQATLGRSFEHGKTQLFVTAQYSDQSPMFVADRINLLQRGYAMLAVNAPNLVGILPGNDAISDFRPLIGATPNFASARTTYPVPAGTPGVTATGRSRPIGFITGSGLPTTAANPWVLTEAQPLTLKSTGAALGGANPYIATLPVGYSASSSPSAIIGGQWNLDLNPSNEGPNGLMVPLGNYPRRKSVMATVTREMTSKLQVHFDYSYNENHAFSMFNPFSSAGGTIIVPATAPINPFNQEVRVAAPINYPAPAVSNTVATSFTLGGTLKLPWDWVAHLDFQRSQSAFEANSADSLSSFNYGSPTFGTLGGTVSDPNPTPYFSGAVNPFVDTIKNPIDLQPFTATDRYSSHTTSNDLIVAASGPLAHLPGGDPRLSVRFERNETVQPGGAFRDASIAAPYLGLPNASPFTFVSYRQNQTTASANAELDLPIFKTKLPMLKSLEVQFNLSRQSTNVEVGTPGYQVFGPYSYVDPSSGVPASGGILIGGPNSLGSDSSMDPNAKPVRYRAVFASTSVTGPALSYKPFDDILIRASVASGYVPPTYTELLPTNTLQVPTTVSITDPKNNGSMYDITSYNLGGNPNLRPTTSKSWDFGVVWQPTKGLLKGLRLDAEFVETKQFNQILDLGVQGFINLEGQFPDQVVRDSATGDITTVYDKFINLAESKQSSWTYTLGYERSTAFGNFGLTASESIQEHNQQEIVAGTNFLEFVGYPNSGGVAKTKATGTLRWAFHNVAAAWTVVSFGGYKQYGAPGDPGAYASELETGAPYSLNTQYTMAQGANTVPSQTYHNLYVSYAFPKDPFDRNSRWGRWTNAFLSGMKISLFVNNVFNTLPPFDAYYPPFFASPYGDLRLRSYEISLKKSF